MAKVLKITGIVILVLIMLIGIGIFSLVHFVDPNKFKNQIDKAVYDTTGHHLTINGNVSWSFFPWLGFKVTDIELSNASGFGDKPFAKANKIDISLQVMPLLSGKIDVSNIELDGLQINLQRNVSGVGNWTDFSTKASISPTSQAQPVSTTAKVDPNIPTTSNNGQNTLDFSIANLTIVNGQVNFEDLKSNQHYTIKNLYINGSNVGTEQVFPLTISAVIDEKNFPKPLNVSLSGQYNITNTLSSVAINQIDVHLNDLEMQGDISVSDVNTKPRFQGDFHLTPVNLRTTLQQFSIELPVMKKTDALTKISTDMAFNGNMDGVSIKPLSIDVDNSKLSGNLEIKNFAKPQINFKLNVNQFNVDNYLPAKTPAPKNAAASAANTAATTPKSTDTPINLPTDLLRTLNVRGQITIDQLMVSGLHISNLNSTLNATQGVIKLTPITLDLYEGNATANAILNVQTAIPAYQFAMTTSKIQIEPFVNDLMNKDFVSGTANLSANLSTNGNTVNTLIGRLDGNSRFQLSNGLIKGINIKYQLDNAKALLNKQTPPAKAKDNDTPFGNLSGTININNGVATNNDLSLTNPAFTASGKGTADLNKQTINYQLNLTTTKLDELKGYRIPLTITGPLTKPAVNLNTNDILQQIVDAQKQRLMNQAKQRAATELQQQAGKYVSNKQISKALDNLFG
jgi:AsmA protein